MSKEDLTLTLDQVAHIAELTRLQQPAADPTGNNYNEAIGKVSVIVFAALLVWAGATIYMNSKGISAIDAVKREQEEMRAEFREFASKPRFTAEDFTQEIKPIVQLLERHDAQLNARQDWMATVGTRVVTLENRYEVILDKLNTQERHRYEKEKFDRNQ